MQASAGLAELKELSHKTQERERERETERDREVCMLLISQFIQTLDSHHCFTLHFHLNIVRVECRDSVHNTTEKHFRGLVVAVTVSGGAKLQSDVVVPGFW
jgi:hypothetical protein